MLNTTLISGRITHHLELRVTTTGTPVCKFSIAFPDKINKDESLFLNVHCTGNLAEEVERKYSKGELVTIKGNIVPGSYEDKNGVKHYKVTLRAEDVY